MIERVTDRELGIAYDKLTSEFARLMLPGDVDPGNCEREALRSAIDLLFLHRDELEKLEKWDPGYLERKAASE